MPTCDWMKGVCGTSQEGSKLFLETQIGISMCPKRKIQFLLSKIQFGVFSFALSRADAFAETERN